MKVGELIGKAITNARIQKQPMPDDVGFLKLNFSDDSECTGAASFGIYAENSLDEYPSLITVSDKFIDHEGEFYWMHK